MDWKTYYRSEWDRPGAAARMISWLRGESADPTAAWSRSDLVSFPHTALRYAGALQAAVVRWIYASRFRRVLALGVLHGANLETYRTALDQEAVPTKRKAGFNRVRGGFTLPATALETPFGSVPTWRPAKKGRALRTDTRGITTAEFSLDTFLALCALAAEIRGTEPIPVFPIYIGMTCDPIRGTFDAAEEIAASLRSWIDEETAVVTTGDLVHYGRPYGPTQGDLGAQDLGDLAEWMRSQVEEALNAALTRRDFTSSYLLCRDRLKNDQREILPVLADLLGRGAYQFVHFELSDYSEILAVDPPCYVGSSLVRFFSATK